MRHQKGTTRSDTGPHAVASNDTTISDNDPRRHSRCAGIRIDTEEVTGSIPVSPTTPVGP